MHSKRGKRRDRHNERRIRIKNKFFGMKLSELFKSVYGDTINQLLVDGMDILWG